MTQPARRDNETAAVEPAPAVAAAAAPPERTSVARILALQRSAGNAAVTAYLAREEEGATATVSAIDTWRELLDDGDEEGAITQAGQLSPDDASTALTDQTLRALAVSTFDDEEMSRAMLALQGGTLLQKLNWMSVEGSSLELVLPLITATTVPAEQKTELYGRSYIRDLFVDMCSNEEMATVVGHLGGTLEQKLSWMLTEGADWAVVEPMLGAATTPATEKTHLYGQNYMRDLFVDLLDNEQMAAAVRLLGGTVSQKLDWMIHEGTSGELVFPIIGLAPASELFLTTPLPDYLDTGLEAELSAADYRRARSMLTTGLMNSGEVDESRIESHYELKDSDDPTQGYELQDFLVQGVYETVYTRSELRVKVRIGFTGVAAEPAHLAVWTGGIEAKWNNHFRVTNDQRELPIVFEPVWNSADEHHEIELHLPPVVREDAANWYAGPGVITATGATQDTTDANTAAHEFGHLVGLADEYNLTAADYEKFTGAAPTGAMPADGYDTTSVMAVISGPAEGRHMAPFIAWLNANRIPGEPAYRLVGTP